MHGIICPRFIHFNTALNVLPRVRNHKLNYKTMFLLFSVLLYFMVFDYYLIILMPSWFFNVKIFNKHRISFFISFSKISHQCIFNSALCGFKILRVFFIHFYYLCLCYCDIFSLWCVILHLVLSLDVHPNPGPFHSNNQYYDGFLSFCNWNLNSLFKDDFQRISLLEAHNVSYNYDIISLCETSLNEDVRVPENILPGYKFYSCDFPGGTRSGGVGIFYKETLPLRIRHDLSFDECIVSELIFGHKKIFFTILYRNPECKAHTPGFENFLVNLENLYLKIKNENPFVVFFTGDFNGHSQSWYPDGDTNAEGVLLDNLFCDLNLTQLISEATHFMRDDCKPSCIDLIITDQPNIVLESGTRHSLDPFVKHEIIFCKLNFKIPLYRNM